MAANPQWWMLEVFGGFGPHTSYLKFMQYRANNKIISVKEERDSSHCNQAYGKFAGKSDKSAKTYILSMLRGSMLCVNRARIDQWGPIHVGLFAIPVLKEETWTNSFRYCNMDPRLHLRFDQWCKNVEGFLQAGEIFKEEEPLYMYSMLPSTWYGMIPAEKCNMMNFIDLHGGIFSVDL